MSKEWQLSPFNAVQWVFLSSCFTHSLVYFAVQGTLSIGSEFIHLENFSTWFISLYQSPTLAAIFATGHTKALPRVRFSLEVWFCNFSRSWTRRHLLNDLLPNMIHWSYFLFITNIICNDGAKVGKGVNLFQCSSMQWNFAICSIQCCCVGFLVIYDSRVDILWSDQFSHLQALLYHLCPVQVAWNTHDTLYADTVFNVFICSRLDYWCSLKFCNIT